MVLLVAVAGLLTVVTLMVALYHMTLAAVDVSCPYVPSMDVVGRMPTQAFAIVIPAHNEEKVIGATINSCRSLDYPSEKYHVFVIADNCTDGTPEVVKEHGTTCLVRCDPQRRGKGYALMWAFEHILPQGFDAILVLDADCVIEPHALLAFDRYLARGDRVLQANNIAANPDDSPVSYAVALANFLENDLFYASKSRLGLAVFLRGTGMVIRTSVLAKHPWRASSLAEDTEYSLQLLREHVTVRFVPEVRVSSPFPAEGRQLSVQRSRWVGGTLSFSRTQAWTLIIEGFLSRNFLLMDAGWTLFNLVRSLLILWVILTLAVTGTLAYFYPSRITVTLLVVSSISAFLLHAYVLLGIFRFGLSRKRLAFLAQMPICIARMIGVATRGLLGMAPDRWGYAARSLSN